MRESLGLEIDALAALYDASISARNRRRLGTVFTPAPVVEHMLSMADAHLEELPACVIDPGAGVGAFTIAAARRWPSSTVVAIDINVVTLGLLATRIAFEMDAEPDETDRLERIELVLGDYLDEIDRRFTQDTTGPIAVVGNPPYTRTQGLPAAEKEKANKAASGIIDSGHANMAMLFQAATLTRMRPQDISCLILPGSFSYTRASRGLRSTLWNSRRPVEVHRWPATERAFTGRSVQAAILSVGPERPKQSSLRLSRVALGNPSVKVIESWTRSREALEPSNWFWSPKSDEAAEGDTVSLSEIATVRRGVATGANTMFFIPDELAAELPDDVVVPGMPTLRDFDGEVLDREAHASWGGPQARRWLLAVPLDRVLTGRLGEYVESFEAEVRPRHLPSKRKAWYSLGAVSRPTLLISPLSKGNFKVVMNTVKAVPSNNLFGVSPLNSDIDVALASWLRSEAGQRELRRVSRRYPGGSFKVEPADLASIRVPQKFTNLA